MLKSLLEMLKTPLIVGILPGRGDMNKRGKKVEIFIIM